MVHGSHAFTRKKFQDFPDCQDVFQDLVKARQRLDMQGVP